MKPFTKQELIGVVSIFLVVAVITVINLRVSIRRARDAQRRADLGAISNVLDAFQSDFGFFPASENGLIKDCRSDNFEKTLQAVKESEEKDIQVIFDGLRGCRWGEDKIDDLGLFGDEPKVYINKLPQDPKLKEGITYLYLSNRKRFQLFAHLEGGSSEEGYNEGIVARGLKCGKEVCNFGKSFSTTPLDLSIEEYEKRLEEERDKVEKL